VYGFRRIQLKAVACHDLLSPPSDGYPDQNDLDHEPALARSIALTIDDLCRNESHRRKRMENG
jgi:hypothetical protein